MRRLAIVVHAILIASATAGCAQQQAQTLAANLGRLTHSYDAARATKARAEMAYYSEQLRILRGALGGSFVVSDEKGATIEKGVPVDHSLAYGRIVTNSRRDAYLLAENFATPGPDPQSGSALLKFLEGGLREDREAFIQAQQRQQQLRADLLASLEKIDRQEARLETIMKELKKLEQPRSLKVTAEQLYAIGRAVQTRLMQTEGGTQ